jgi:prevent-host-death family protein
MDITMTATKAKAEFLGLIDRVASGDSGPVTVTKHGKAKVMIVRLEEFSLLEQGYGALRGQAFASATYDPFGPAMDHDPSADAENLLA